MTRHFVPFAAALLAGALAATPVLAEDDAAARDQRWTELRQDVFGDRAVEQSKDVVALDAPVRAEDAALVPMAIKTADPAWIKGLTLIIDENPGPVAARVTFGPAGDAGLLKLRTRVNTYTNVHAVAETTDGKLFDTVRFVKASGGCSAPAGSSEEEAMKGMGEMRLKVRDEITPGKSAQATLMIRHPNFNGMQMDQITRAYTPARYIKEIKVTYNDKDVFSLVSDISLSTDPVIEFGFKPEAKGQIKVAATDTEGGHWEKTFDVPTQSN
ncbi:quinoprotein dehydrogenase-associated SoxYZ-like carrier [Hansschlegelia sp.]|uniref:quinoprotein dehydrogenase-associated SoxYZ-like carrier n=1 Tax=Hansschlegelia sp. TaxID=2041892 RepID=UPI002CA6C098|nr:quinoprotein dehydrogenase-associated SoxYZ-like carrier [Hansschlegelia sp.]HVI29944.1 quinoprotein dehydrogenase-associated SoxYZ-like carrier [Hansschlegelia sp.]